MSTINLRVDNDTLSILSPGAIVSGSKNYYRLSVRFTADWDGLAKAAVISVNGGDRYSVALNEESSLDRISSAVIPEGLVGKSGRLEIGVIGKEGDSIRITTNCAQLKVLAGVSEGSTVPPLPEAGWNEYLEGKVNSALADIGAATAEKAGLMSSADKQALDSLSSPFDGEELFYEGQITEAVKGDPTTGFTAFAKPFAAALIKDADFVDIFVPLADSFAGSENQVTLFAAKLTEGTYNATYSPLKEKTVTVTEAGNYRLELDGVAIEGETLCVGFMAESAVFCTVAKNGFADNPYVGGTRLYRRSASSGNWLYNDSSVQYLVAVFGHRSDGGIPTAELNRSVRAAGSFDGSLRVGLVSDIHFNQNADMTGGTGNERLETLVESLNAEHRRRPFNFVLFVGDLVTIHNGDIPHKNELLEELVRTYLSRLNMPWYALRGNHDAYSDADWERIIGNKPQFSAETELYYFICADNYAYTGDGDFLYGGSDLAYSGVDSRLDYMKAEIAKAKAKGKKIFAVYHYHNPSETIDAKWKELLSSEPDIIGQIMGHSHVAYTQKKYGKADIGTGNFGALPRSSDGSYSKANGFGYKILEMNGGKLSVFHCYPSMEYPAFPTAMSTEKYTQAASNSAAVELDGAHVLDGADFDLSRSVDFGRLNASIFDGALTSAEKRIDSIDRTLASIAIKERSELELPITGWQGGAELFGDMTYQASELQGFARSYDAAYGNAEGLKLRDATDISIQLPAGRNVTIFVGPPDAPIRSVHIGASSEGQFYAMDVSGLDIAPDGKVILGYRDTAPINRTVTYIEPESLSAAEKILSDDRYYEFDGGAWTDHGGGMTSSSGKYIRYVINARFSRRDVLSERFPAEELNSLIGHEEELIANLTKPSAHDDTKLDKAVWDGVVEALSGRAREYPYADGDFTGYDPLSVTAADNSGVILRFNASAFENGISSVSLELPFFKGFEGEETVKLVVCSFANETAAVYDRIIASRDVRVSAASADEWYTVDLGVADLSGIKVLGVGYIASSDSSACFHKHLHSAMQSDKLLGGNADAAPVYRPIGGNWRVTNRQNRWVSCKFNYKASAGFPTAEVGAAIDSVTAGADKSLRFVCCSDIHFDQNGVYKMTENDDSFTGTDGKTVNVSNERRMNALVDVLNAEHRRRAIDFVIFNGDMITLHANSWTDPNSPSESSVRTDRLRLLVSKYLSRLEMPWFAMRGNHDEYTAEEWETIMGNSPQFSLETDDLYFICPDTYDELRSSYNGTGSVNAGVDARLGWIDEQLAAASALGKRAVAVFHDLRYSTVNDADRQFYDKYCANGSLAAIIDGHVHRSEVRSYGAVPVYLTGSFGHIPSGSLNAESTENGDGSSTVTTSTFYPYDTSERFGFRLFEMSGEGLGSRFIYPAYEYDWCDKQVVTEKRSQEGKTLSSESKEYSLSGEAYVEGSRKISYAGASGGRSAVTVDAKLAHADIDMRKGSGNAVFKAINALRERVALLEEKAKEE